MITFSYTPLKDFIKTSSPTNPTKEVIENFGKEIELFLQKAITQDDEEFQKNEVNKFLGKVYGYDCNTKGSVDSAIYIEGEAQVLIEAKALKNKAEFPKDTLLCKALYESILYFLRETKKYDNNSIKHIILCNPYEFYIFDATSFKVFSKDKKIEKLYKNCDGKEGTDKSNPKFYKDLENYLKGEFEDELPYTHFSLKDKLSTQELCTIYQLLSPQVLLKVRKTLDANTLNKGFYEELLYILGLQEVSESGKSGGKIIITPSHTPNSLSNAITNAYGLDTESTFTLITTWNNRILFLALLESMLLGFKHINKPFLDYSIIKDFTTLQSLFFEVLAKKTQSRSPSLIPEFASIPYLNSSLFDQIALEKEGKNIGALSSLPLQLFSRSILKKDPNFKDKDSLPLLEYLFEFLHAYDFTTTPKDISNGVKQNHDRLINSAVLGLVFEKLNGYKEGSFYTPSFITSYMCKQSITEALIDKFNTTYSWKCQSLEELREEMGIKGFRENRSAYLQTLLSLKICDPSVGSGHFLVSALNEMILIAYTLRLIPSLYESTLELENDEILIKTYDELHQYTKPTSSKQLSHQIQVELFNLKKSIIENCLFGVDINPNSCEITKLRLWIELLKYSFYLFDESGANTNALETLPNIDINIKCGNSLISRFSLDDNLNKIKNIKKKIQEYKELVAHYKDPNPLYPLDKTQLTNKILELKVLFSLTLKDPKTKAELEKAIKTHIELYNDFALDDESLLEGLNIGAKNLFGTPELSPKEEEEAFASYGKIRALRKKLDSALSGEEYKNAFEWRFEFPEVLDEEGNFLGFDAIIGNPPYISAPSQEENPQLSIQRKTLTSNKRFKSLASKWDLYIPFIELGISFLCKENAICSMIIPYSLANQIYGKKLREMLTSNFNLYELTDLRGTKVFDSATVINCIVFAKKQSPLNVLAISKIDENQKISKHFEKTYSELIQDEKNQVWNTTQEKRNLSHCADFNLFGDFCYISYGLRPNSDEKKAKGKFKKEDLISDTQDKIHCKPYIEAKDFEKYRIKRIRYLEYGTERCPAQIARPTFEELYQYPKLMFNVMGDLCGTFNDKQIFHNHSIIACVLWKDLLGVENRSIKDGIKRYSRFDRQTMEKLSQNMNLKFILGILNSKYAQKLLANLRGDDYHIYPEHIRNLPIPQITESNQSTADKIIALVEKILDQKEKDPSSSTQELESQIDSLVYTLYNLTDGEIKTIEGEE